MIHHDYRHLTNEEIKQMVSDNIDILVPKDISIEQYIARALEVSRQCNTWQVGMCNTDSLSELYVTEIAIKLYAERR